MVRQKLLELELSGPMAHSGEQCLFLRAAFRSEGKRQHWPRRSFCDYLPYFEHLWRSEEHTSELQSLMRISYAVFCLKKKNKFTSYTITKIFMLQKINT